MSRPAARRGAGAGAGQDWTGQLLELGPEAGERRAERRAGWSSGPG